MIKRLFWVGIGATAGWLGNQKFQETKTHVQQRIDDEGLGYPVDLAKQSAGFLFHSVKGLVSQVRQGGEAPPAAPGEQPTRPHGRSYE